MRIDLRKQEREVYYFQCPDRKDGEFIHVLIVQEMNMIPQTKYTHTFSIVGQIPV